MIYLEGYFDGSVKNNKSIYAWIYTVYKKKNLNQKYY